MRIIATGHKTYGNNENNQFHRLCNHNLENYVEKSIRDNAIINAPTKKL